ncbi:hypothetical protein Ddye_019191 [Dipteronia dyeriana]|uniref:Uncharacterized protein n=1 Tax=Dipteronia dyeriana TaxID=168575 RepID=A0AAD9WUU1_9ROSI|nr:hypothetical protein Ddye_019191 [Dipteronia dyeriana]
MQNQVHNQGQSLPIPLSANQPQPRQRLLSQNIQNSMPIAGVQSSSGLPSVLPLASGLNQTPISSVIGQNSNMQNICSVSQNAEGSSMGQGAPSKSLCQFPETNILALPTELRSDVDTAIYNYNFITYL